jgi:hypothetical protein
MPKVSARAKTGQGSKLEAKVAADLKALGLMEDCQRQYRFHPTRKWMIDFFWDTCEAGYWINKPIALEVNGGTYMQGSSRRTERLEPKKHSCLQAWMNLDMDTSLTKSLVDRFSV